MLKLSQIVDPSTFHTVHYQRRNAPIEMALSKKICTSHHAPLGYRQLFRVTLQHI